MNEDFARDQAIALFKQFESFSLDRIEASTVAIIRGNDPVVAQLGTGILFQIADRSFVITAAHVILEASKLGAGLGVSNAKRGFVATPGDWICSKEQMRNIEDSWADIAVYPLSDEQCDGLDGKEFIRLADVDVSVDWPTAHFMIYGYPEMMCEPSTLENKLVQLGAFKLGTWLYTGSTLGLDKFDGLIHLLLDGSDDDLVDSEGSSASLKTREPHSQKVALTSGLKGISGWPVWRLGKAGLRPDAWGREHLRVVAVQTGVYRNSRIIKATRWSVVIQLLRSRFPEIRPALALHNPAWR